MNRISFCFLIFFSWIQIIQAQLSNEAWDNFTESTFEETTDNNTSDVTIIYDRTYIDINQTRVQAELKVEVLKTIHRKIKINSLYGLEKYNKLYIPTIFFRKIFRKEYRF